MLTRALLAANHSRGTSELCQRQRKTVLRGQEAPWQGASFEAKATESWEKRVDVSGKEREEQRKRFSASYCDKREHRKTCLP